jgi:hypothetical protein
MAEMMISGMIVILSFLPGGNFPGLVGRPGIDSGTLPTLS